MPSSAAPPLTLKFPPLVEAALQAEKLPLSKPSLKIRSGTEDVGVAVNVGAGVLVFVGVKEGPDVGVCVGVFVAVTDGPTVGVLVGVLPGIPSGRVSNSSGVGQTRFVRFHHADLTDEE